MLPSFKLTSRLARTAGSQARSSGKSSAAAAAVMKSSSDEAAMREVLSEQDKQIRCQWEEGQAIYCHSGARVKRASPESIPPDSGIWIPGPSLRDVPE